MLGGDVGTIDGCIVGGSDSASTRGAHQSSASAEVRQRRRGRRRARSSGRRRAGGPFGGSPCCAASVVVIYRLIRMFASLRYRAGRPRAAGSAYAPRFIVIGLYNRFRCACKSAFALCEILSCSPVSWLLCRWQLAFLRVGTGGDGYQLFSSVLLPLALQLLPNLSCGLFELLWSYLLHSAAAEALYFENSPVSTRVSALQAASSR